MSRSTPHICLDASMFRERLSGIGYYALGLMGGLIDAMPEARLSIYDGFSFRPLDAEALASVQARNGGEARAAPSPARHFWQRLPYAALRLPGVRPAYRSVKRQRFIAAAQDFDVFHALNFLPAWTGNFACLPTVYDLSVLRYPETHPEERVRLLNDKLGWLAARPLIHTISQFSADEISDVLAIPASRIRVTYPGVNPIFTPREEPEDAAALATLGLEKQRYFLAVGTIEPRKNLAVLVKAFASLPPQQRRSHPLVLLGQRGWGAALEGLEPLLAEGSVRIAGYGREVTLAALYRHASSLLFPSLYEGFGLPVAEALASGTRPIVSDIPVMREVGADVVDYVDPHDVVAWREAILRRMDPDAALRKIQQQQSVARAGEFDWADNAAATAQIYRSFLVAIR